MSKSKSLMATTKVGGTVRLFVSSMGEPMLDLVDARKLAPDKSLSVDQCLFRAASLLRDFEFKGYGLSGAYLRRLAR